MMVACVNEMDEIRSIAAINSAIVEISYSLLKCWNRFDLIFYCNSYLYYRFVRFGALLYSKPWIESPSAADAPVTDLMLWNDLDTYDAIDSEISSAVKKVMSRHIWYLSDELVGLSLFSDKITSDEKNQIVSRMKITSGLVHDRKVRGNADVLKLKTSL